MVRRGNLVSYSTDKMIPKARVNTGRAIENDNIDVIFPVGYTAHVTPGDKTEVITFDPTGDASKRVAFIFGDRQYMPKPKEGEAVLYSPTDKNKNVSVSKDDGIAINGDDKPINAATKGDIGLESIEGNLSMKAAEMLSVAAKAMSLLGRIEVDEAGNITLTGNTTIKGNLVVEGNVNVTGTVHAANIP